MSKTEKANWLLISAKLKWTGIYNFVKMCIMYGIVQKKNLRNSWNFCEDTVNGSEWIRWSTETMSRTQNLVVSLYNKAMHVKEQCINVNLRDFMISHKKKVSHTSTGETVKWGLTSAIASITIQKLRNASKIFFDLIQSDYISPKIYTLTIKCITDIGKHNFT